MPLRTINGTPLAYDVAGEGDGVVLVHGAWNQRQAWIFVASALVDSFRVVAYDRRGHGESQARPDAGTVHDDVADLAALIEALDVAPADVVGNSGGANVALGLVAKRPDLVRRMVAHEPAFLNLLDATPETWATASELRRQLGEVRERLEAGDRTGAAQYFVEDVILGPGTWAMLPPQMQQVFVGNAFTFLGELRDPDNFVCDVAALGGASAPVLLTQGDQSPAFFARIIERIAGILPDAHRHTIEGAGHVPHLTHPEVYADVIRKFLIDA